MRAALAGLFLAFVTAIALAQLQPPIPAPGEVRNSNQKEAATVTEPPKSDKRGTKDFPLVIETLESQSDADEKKAVAKHRDNESANNRHVVWLTTGLLGVAFFQAILFVWQLRFMRLALRDAKISADAATIAANAASAGAKLAREQFISAHRPVIRVKHVWASALTSEVPFGVEVVVVNTGATNARVVAYAIECRIEGGINQLPPRPEFRSRAEMDEPLASGVALAITRVTPDIFGAEAVRETQQGNRLLYCYGYIEYIDDLDRRRKTAFCRCLNYTDWEPGTAGRFVKHANRDYEYQE